MPYDVETIAALASGELVLRDFVVISGQTLGGDPASFGYWTGEDNVAINVTPPGASTPVSTNFIGGGSLLSVPEIVDAIGLEAQSVSFGFDHTSTAAGSPMDMVFGHNVRAGRIALYRGVFNPATWNLVSEPHLIFAGRIDGASVDDAAAGGEGGLTIEAVSSAIDLTRINPALESDAQQRLRDGDRFRRYGDTAATIETWWGQAKGKKR